MTEHKFTYDPTEALEILGTAAVRRKVYENTEPAAEALLSDLVALKGRVPGVEIESAQEQEPVRKVYVTVSFLGAGRIVRMLKGGEIVICEGEYGKGDPVEFDFDAGTLRFIGPAIEDAPPDAQGRRPRRSALAVLIEAVLKSMDYNASEFAI